MFGRFTVVSLASASIFYTGVLALAPPALAQEQVVDYWIGDLNFSGRAQQDGAVNLNGGTLSFNTGRSDPVNGQARIKVWVAEDGVPRLQINNCVSALFPAQNNVTFETGGLFTPDLAYAGSSPRCGMEQGEVVVEQSNVLTPTAEGIHYSYRGLNRIENPYTGRVTIAGEALLRPVYRRVPPPSISSSRAAAQPQQAAPAEGTQLGGLAATIDAVIRVDSNGWLMNRYDRGSVTNERILERSDDGRSLIAYGEYTYNSGQPGWIRIRMRGGEVECMEYWDFAGRCRPLGTASYGAQLAIGLLAAAASAPPTPSQEQSPSMDGFRPTFNRPDGSRTYDD